MTEPWQIHVCPVHGQRTPNTLGDCPVGCCAEAMEVVPVVRDARGDGVDVIELQMCDCGHVCEDIYDVAQTCPNWRGHGAADWRGSPTMERVKLVPVEQLRGAVEAIEAGRQWIEPYGKADAPLAEQITALVDACSYWHQVAESGGQSTAAEAFEQSSGGETLEEAQARQLRGEHAFSPQPESPVEITEGLAPSKEEA